MATWQAETDQTEAEPLARALVEALGADDQEKFLALLHEDCVIEYPMRFEGIPERLAGKASYEKVKRKAPSAVRRTVAAVEINSFADPSFALAEFEIEHRWTNGKELKMRQVILVGAREGKIVFVRDYFDTRAVAASAAYESLTDVTE